MQITINFPDSIYNAEPQTWDAYFKALQEMADRFANSYHKYHANCSLQDQVVNQDEMRFTRQRMAMYDGIIEGACDCGRANDRRHTASVKGHLRSCFLVRMDGRLDTGNTENCLDAANGLIIERIYPNHPKAHFRSQSTEESPGISFHDE